jgi:aminoglycoside phosphotransferase (APT) family kinase protein
VDPEQLAAALTIIAQRRLGADAQVGNVEPVSAGASAQTWRFDLLQGGSVQPLIVQLAAGELRFSGALDKARQAAVQQAAWERGVPTPKVYWILDSEDGLGQGYIAERIEGETLGKRIVGASEFAGAREAMGAQCGRILAQIHAIRPTEVPGLPAHAPAMLVGRLAAEHHGYGERLPIFALAIRWLNDNLPRARPQMLLHGDFRTGNFIVDGNGICAVLDWELAHVGDPMEDLGWLCMNAWRFGQLDRPVGGFGTRDQLYAVYEQAAGCAVDPNAIRFWEVYGTLKWGVICQYLTFQYLGGDVRSLERAAIGRRVSETELDLLTLIEGVACR